MNQDACIELGKVVKAHGLDGEIKVSLDVQEVEAYLGLKLIYLGKKNEGLIPYVVKKFQPLSDSEAFLALETIDNRQEAETLLSNVLFYPKDMLPVLPEGEYYYFQIVGFQVRDEQKGVIGNLREIRDLPGNEIMVVDFEGREILIPMVSPILQEVNLQEKLIRVDLPDGLLELYLGA